MASSPNWALYYTPSPAEWAAAFSGKVDVGGDASSNTVVPTGGTAPVTLAAIAAAVPAVSSGNVLGNSGASSAMPYDCTLSALIDRALGASEGSILCRGPTAWVALTPGASGQVLITGGPGAAPSWAAGAATLPDLRAVGEVHLYDPQWGGHFSTPLAAAIAGITKATNGVVTTRQPHGWASGQSIVLNSIGGMTALNGATVTIAVLSATAFSIGVNTTGYSAYTGGGVAVPTAGTIQDDAPAILAAAASFNGHGGTIRVGAGKAIYIGSNCLLPPGVSIEGPFPNPGAVVSNDSNNYTPYTAIIISPSATLSLGESGAIRNFLIYPQGMVWPVPGVTVMPTSAGQFIRHEPVAAGVTAIWLAAATAPVVAQSLMLPAAEPATTTLTLMIHPGAASTVTAEVMSCREDLASAGVTTDTRRLPFASAIREVCALLMIERATVAARGDCGMIAIL